MAKFISIPNRWNYVYLPDICKIQTGKKDVNQGNPNGQYPFFTCAVERSKSDNYSFNDESILLPGNGANVGMVFYYHGKFEAYQRTYVLNEFTENVKFIFYFFKRFWKDHLEGKQSGSAINYIRIGNFNNFQIPMPSKYEQELIVTKIEEHFSQLDAGVAGLKHAQAGLKRYRASVLKAAFEGRLVPQDPNDETIIEQLKKLNISFTENSNSEELPNGWIEIKLKELGFIGTGATPLRSKCAYWLGGTIPWVKSGAINEPYINHAEEYITPKALDETNAKMFKSGSLLVAMYGEGKTRGKVSELMIDAATNQACAAIQFNDETKIFKPYLKLFFLKYYEELRQLASGGVQPNLNLTIIRNIKINLPPIAEQKRIVNKLDSILSIIQKMENVTQVSLRFSEGLHQSILKKAFEGKLLQHILEENKNHDHQSELTESTSNTNK